jgi:hypothetical protein
MAERFLLSSHIYFGEVFRNSRNLFEERNVNLSPADLPDLIPPATCGRSSKTR